MYRVKNIEWLSKEARESEILFSDGQYELKAFSQPTPDNVEIGASLNLPLNSFCTESVVRAESKELSIEKQSDFAYYLTAELINKKEGVVKIGQFLIVLDVDIPGDIVEGEYISFRCDRVDYY